jgi:hypothetical protein
VRSGKTLSGIKVGLRKGTLYVISGSVINKPSNVAHEILVVRLRSPETPWRWPGVNVEANGGFIVRDVEPGQYDLYLEEAITQNYVGRYGGATAEVGARRRGQAAVTVTDKNIAGVTVSY